MASRTIYFDFPKNGEKTANNDISLTTNENAVLESVENIILTQPFTRVYKQRPFGADLEQFLFEPIDETTAIRMMEQIENSIDRFEGRIRDLTVEITPRPDENEYEIDVSFFIDQSDRQLNLNTTLRRVR